MTFQKQKFDKSKRFMGLPTPPVLQKTTKKKPLVAKIILTVIYLGLALWLVIPILVGVSAVRKAFNETQINIVLADDKFKVSILGVKSKPNFFEERIRVQCSKDMRDVGVLVCDLNQISIFEITTPSGEIVYQEGHPRKIGQSMPIRSGGNASTCEILFRVSTTSTNTIWHGEQAGGTIDTSLTTPMTVSEIKTNWPNSYRRGTILPLGNLGQYKILLFLK